MAGVDRASAADAMELVCDVSGTSMQIAVVLVLRGSAADLESARRVFDDRIRCVPRLRQRLLTTPFGCGRPVWVDDSTFDIARHVRSLPCPAPGDEQALLDVVADVITHRLPPGQPLWAATLITGLTDDRTAVLVVFHHVLADGIGGLAILGALADDAPCAAEPGFPRRPPSRRELLLDALHDRGRAVRGLPAAMGRLGAAATELGTRRRPTSAPRCSLNRSVGRHRALAVVRADLTAVRAAAHAIGGTVNDVLIAGVTGALRSLLAERGEDVDRLVVSMPVSARRRASVSALGNQVGVIPVDVPTTGDPAERLAAVAEITRHAKTDTPGASAALLGPAFRVLARIGVFGWFIAHQRLINTFVSNLRGPQRRLRFLGAPVVELIPVSMITGNVTVAFTALSYAGTLVVTVVADPEQCPETAALREALALEFAELTRTRRPVLRRRLEGVLPRPATTAVTPGV